MALRGLGTALPTWLRIAWWGLVEPRGERTPLIVHQAVVLRGREAAAPGEVLLSVRRDLHGWELPGGAATPGESGEEAVRREVYEETGLDVEVEGLVGDYIRTGFRPHTARIYRCRPKGGALRTSVETAQVRWFASDRVPATLFPWYRTPLADALAGHAAPVQRRETWGAREILEGIWIDLRMRLSGDRAG